MAGYHDDFFALNFKVLKLGGLWALVQPGGGNHRHIACTLACVLLCQVYCFLVEIYLFKDAYGDLEGLIDHSGILMSHVLGNFKMLSLHLNRKRLLAILATLRKDELEIYGGALATKETARKVTLLFFVLANCVPITKALPAFLGLWSYSDVDFASGNVTCQEFLPFLIVLPFSTKSTSSCSFGFLFQTLYLVVYAWQIIGHDTLYASCLLCVESHVIILQRQFRSIRVTCLKSLGLPPGYDVLHDADDPDLDGMMNSQMRRLTVQLQTLIRVCKDLEVCFTFVTLLQVLGSMFILMSCLFMASTVSILSGGFVAQIEYYVTIITQLSLYCWFGNGVTHASSKLLDSMYEGDWLAASPRFKQTLLINMIRTKTPVTLTIGKFSPLTLSTLVGIIRASYSYFAVLKR